MSINNFNFNDYDELPPVNINEEHMPIVLAVDISGSMAGKPIENLMKSVNRFKDDVCKDPKVAGRLDIAVVAFNSEVFVEQNWRPIEQMNPVSFVAGGGTNLSAALEKSVEMLKERGHLYEDHGIGVKMPYLILITDGYGGDVTAVSEEIRQRVADKKMQQWVLAVPGYDKETVAKLTDGKRVFELIDEAGYDFSEFFDFMTVSIKAVSVCAPGERVKIDSDIGKEGSTCRIPNLEEWLND